MSICKCRDSSPTVFESNTTDIENVQVKLIIVVAPCLQVCASAHDAQSYKFLSLTISLLCLTILPSYLIRYKTQIQKRMSNTPAHSSFLEIGIMIMYSSKVTRFIRRYKGCWIHIGKQWFCLDVAQNWWSNLYHVSSRTLCIPIKSRFLVE